MSDRGLDVRVSPQGRIHPAVEHSKMGRIGTQQLWRQFSQAGTNARRVRRQVSRPQRTALTISRDPRVGLHGNHRRIEYCHGIFVGPTAPALCEREIHLVGFHAGDLHGLPSLLSASNDDLCRKGMKTFIGFFP